MNTVTNPLKNSVIKSNLPFLMALTASLLLLSGCGPSPAQGCIDEKSSLWDSKAVSKADNQAYWNAIKSCNEKYK
jgi:hypothetical protein